MIPNDWIALGMVVLFLVAGSPRGPWRRIRVSLLVTLFLGMHVYPWWARQRPWDSVMPFIYYRLYVGPAPGRVSQPEMTVVATDGREYPIDYRIWQPHVPRYFNVLMDRHIRKHRGVDPEVGELLLARVQEGLAEWRDQGALEGRNGHLLGGFQYPSHQTGAWRWGPDANLPGPEDIASVRIYWTQSVLAARRENPEALRRSLLWDSNAR